MRKTAAALLALAVCLTATGCVPHTELNEKAVVEAVAIDYKDGQYEINLQYYNLSGSGSSTQIDPSKPNVLIAKGSGINVYSALSNVEMNCGRELMLGINQTIIIGREALKQGLEGVLSFAKTYYQSHPNVLICTAEDKASDIIQVKFVEGSVSTQKLKFLFNNAGKLGIVYFPTVTEVFIGLCNREETLYLPMLKVGDTGTDASEDGKEVEVSGGVLIRNNTYFSDLDELATAGLQALSGKVDETSVTVEYEGKKLSLELFDVSTELVPEIIGGELVVSVKTSANGKFMDVLSEGGTMENTEIIAKLASEEFIRRMEYARLFVVNNCASDVLQLEFKLRRRDYSAWFKNEEGFTELLQTARFVYTSEISINRYGLQK